MDIAKNTHHIGSPNRPSKLATTHAHGVTRIRMSFNLPQTAGQEAAKLWATVTHTETLGTRLAKGGGVGPRNFRHKCARSWEAVLEVETGRRPTDKGAYPIANLALCGSCQCQRCCHGLRCCCSADARVDGPAAVVATMGTVKIHPSTCHDGPDKASLPCPRRLTVTLRFVCDVEQNAGHDGRGPDGMMMLVSVWGPMSRSLDGPITESDRGLPTRPSSSCR
ncbi:hypothetical protein OH77DRAFT_1426928 [Trametes cingulata]|nr:hypothetical protein OH77DRAFT_1426928 [Trametes cingulata]